MQSVRDEEFEHLAPLNVEAQLNYKPVKTGHLLDFLFKHQAVHFLLLEL